MAEHRLTDPLRRPLFRRLAASYTINELGDWMGIISLSVLVFDQTDSALATAALFLGTRFLPALLAPPLVARTDRTPPRYILPVIYCGEAAVFGALAVLAGHFSLAPVIVLAAIDGALALAGRALTRAVVATSLEPTGELRAGNALLNVAFTGGAAVGPALAGLVVAGFGVQSALLLDAVSFYIVAWTLFTAGSMPHADPEEGRMRDRVRAGIAYIRGETVLARILVAQGIAFVFFAAVLPVEVVYVKESLGSDDTGYGLMLASWGVGMVLGSLVFAGVRQVALPVLLFVSTLAIGVAYLGTAVAPSLVAACAASVLGGIGNGVQWISLVTAVQELTQASYQARVLSLLEATASAMPGVGFLLGGTIAAIFEPRASYAVAGVGVVIVLIAATRALRRVDWTPELERTDRRAEDATSVAADNASRMVLTDR